MSVQPQLKVEVNSLPPSPEHNGHHRSLDAFESPELRAQRERLATCIKMETNRQLVAGSTDIYEQVIQQVETVMIDLVMRESNQNLTRAAHRLGLSRPTLRSKIRSRLPMD